MFDMFCFFSSSEETDRIGIRVTKIHLLSVQRMQIATMSEVKLSLRTDKKHFVNDKKIGKQLCILHLNSSIIYEYSVSFKSPRSSSIKRLIVN